MAVMAVMAAQSSVGCSSSSNRAHHGLKPVVACGGVDCGWSLLQPGAEKVGTEEWEQGWCGGGRQGVEGAYKPMNLFVIHQLLGSKFMLHDSSL